MRILVSTFVTLLLSVPAFAVDQDEAMLYIGGGSKFVTTTDLVVLANKKDLLFEQKNSEFQVVSCRLSVDPSRMERVIKTGTPLVVRETSVVSSNGQVYGVIHFESPRGIKQLTCMRTHKNGYNYADEQIPTVSDLAQVLSSHFSFEPGPAEEF